MKVEWIAFSKEQPPAEFIWILTEGKVRPSHGNWINHIALDHTHWARMELPEPPQPEPPPPKEGKRAWFVPDDGTPIQAIEEDLVLDQRTGYYLTASRRYIKDRVVFADTAWEAFWIESRGKSTGLTTYWNGTVIDEPPCPECYVGIHGQIEKCEKHR